MQEYRKNPDNKLRESTNRVMRSIKNGKTPRPATLEKYGISIEHVNNIRAAQGLEPITEQVLVLPVENNIVALEAKIAQDEKLKKLQDRQIALANEIKKRNQELRENALLFQHQENSTENRKISEATLGDVLDYFNQTIKNKQTAKGYITRLKAIFTKIVKCDVDGDITKCIKDPHLLEKINQYINDKKLSLSTKKGYIQTVLYLISNYPGLQTELASEYEFWKKTFQQIKTESVVEYQSKSKQINTLPYSEILKRVEQEFGPKSQESLLFNLYDQVPSRDDFGDLYMISNEKPVDFSDGDHPHQNYIIVGGKKSKPTYLSLIHI